KPFSLAELRVRIDAILRRIALERGGAPGRCAEPLARPSLQFSADVCDVSLGERFSGLTPTEYRLLETFLAAEGETLTKAFLYQHVLHRGHTQ
ncbi:response regulator transcription factor, partial [Pseudomonas aeruginosa]|nr:response regulator transcription factor [Pseudomonas aeruginosa]